MPDRCNDPGASPEHKNLTRFRIWVEQGAGAQMQELRTYFEKDASRVFGLGIQFLHFVTTEKQSGRVILSVDPKTLPAGFMEATGSKQIF